MKKAIFITATDTGVGKTYTSLILATLLKEAGFDVGIMKPVQCAGNDAHFLKSSLRLKDKLSLINPYYLKYPLAPQVAFSLSGQHFDKEKILKVFEQLKKRHQILLVEGAGGFFVPLSRDYLVSDLIADLDIPVIVVSRPGLGTINHTLLTLKQLQAQASRVLGVIFNQTSLNKMGLAEQTNPSIIEKLGATKILGQIPYLARLDKKSILKLKNKIDLDAFFTPEKKEFCPWQELDKRYIWHPFTQMKDWLKEEQLVIEAAKGSYLKASDGKWYLDGVSSLWVNVHGHRKKEIDHAIKGQLNKVSHSTMLGLSNPVAIELARRLIKIVPRGLKKVFYSDNGSTSVEIALKMAYQYWQHCASSRKKRFIHLKNSYHGDTIGSVSVGGIDLFHKTYQSLLFESISVAAPFCYRCPQSKTYPSCQLQCLEELEDCLERESGSVAGLIVEPMVQAAAGMIVWPKGVLKRMRQLCSLNNVLLIVDEVATGFGRTGRMFACEHEEVSPDIICLAKGITAGYLPLAATVTTEKIYNAFLGEYGEQKTFFHGHTYTGNALGCAAALANLEIFKKEKTLEKLQPKIKIMRQGLNKFRRLEHVGDIRQKGFMVGIELVKDKPEKGEYPWEDKIGIKVCQRVRRDGIILRPLGNVIVLMPPLSITASELKFLLEKTYKAIRQVTG
jgi:adenosylmethionine-8-amino-7-oxononanoate transaminase/dethiobiotin synthase